MIPAVLARTALVLLASATLASCEGIFDVEDPQAFGNEDLNDPVIVKNVADGAEGLLHQSYDDFVQVAALLGDEIESTSTWIDWENVSEGKLRADEPTGNTYAPPQDALLRARYAAQEAATRIGTVLGTAAATSPLMAQVKWVDAFADLTIGMAWCEGPLTQGGPRQPNTEFFKQAVTKLTAALAIANALPNATDKTNWVNVITASRARANLFAGNYDAALADALAVPTGFVKNAVYAEAAGVQQSATGNQFHQNRNRSGGLRRLYHNRVLGTFNSSSYTTGYLADWRDATKPDPRMAVTRKSGELGVNNRFAYFGITKYADRGADQPMLTSREMNLIAAEVYMRKGQYQQMVDKLNIDRRANGLADIPVPTTAADAQNAVVNERMAVLFVEGHRTFDLHRFTSGGVSLHRQILGPGRNTLLPLSRNEILANTNMKEGEGTCPAVTQ